MRLIKLGIGVMGLALFATPPALLAQDSPEPKAEEESDASKWDNMSDQELQQELLRALKATSKGMDNLESELGKASLPDRKPDERYAELKSLTDKLKDGSLEELPEGLEKYFEENPDKLSEVLGESKDAAKELLKDDQKLMEKLGKASEEVAKLLDDADVLEKVVKLQGEVEKNLNDALEAQEQMGESTRSEIESALECAYRLRKQ